MTKGRQRTATSEKARFADHALIHDPIHDAVEITTPHLPGEATEIDLIESPWMQRLKRIHQLQSTWWIFPSAEHTRFQHSIGVMHLAGMFARHFYPYLKSIHPNCPSANHVEELMRLSGLLHDIGHGPFCHYLDEIYLEPNLGLNHEKIGRMIIDAALADAIKAIRRSPGGGFEQPLDPSHIAYLIQKRSDGTSFPQWLNAIKLFFNGLVTVDNIDYVLRDAYWCGIPVGSLSIPRFLHYTFLNEEGLVLHARALSTLQIFLNARFYLYTNIYYHRDVRAIDLQMKEIFKETLDLLLDYKHGKFDLKKYYLLTEWSLLSEMTAWAYEKGGRHKELGEAWEKIIRRDIDWLCVAEQPVGYIKKPDFLYIPSAEQIQKKIEQCLPADFNPGQYLVDDPQQNPRPGNPMEDRGKEISIFDPHSGEISKQPLKSIYDFIPQIHVLFRVYVRQPASNEAGRVFSQALQSALSAPAKQISTNI